MPAAVVAEIVEDIEQNGLSVRIQPFYAVYGDEAGFGGGIGERRAACVYINCVLPGLQRLSDPRLQNVAFARTLCAPKINELVVFLLQDIDQLGIGGAEQFVKTGIGWFAEIKGKLVHGRAAAEWGCGIVMFR